MTELVTIYVDKKGKFIEGDTSDGMKITTQYRADWYLARAHLLVSGPGNRQDPWEVIGYGGKRHQNEVFRFPVAQPVSLEVVLAKARAAWQNHSTKKPFIYVELTLNQ